MREIHRGLHHYHHHYHYCCCCDVVSEDCPMTWMIHPSSLMMIIWIFCLSCSCYYYGIEDDLLQRGIARQLFHHYDDYYCYCWLFSSWLFCWCSVCCGYETYCYCRTFPFRGLKKFCGDSQTNNDVTQHLLLNQN